MSTYLEERRYFPTGCSPDDDDADSFMVSVVWRGRGKWAVLKGDSKYHQLDATGAWRDFPEFEEQLAHCRHDFDDACALAEVAVETMELRRERWPQFIARRRGHAPATNPEVELADEGR